MDALAGYGSDSSSTSAETSALQHSRTTNNPLAALIGATGSDSDSSDDDAPQQQKSVTAQPVSKRQKIEKEKPMSKPILPPPETSENSLYLWDKDYLKRPRGTKTSDKDSHQNTKALSEKLAKIAQSLEISWADHLKSQHEFHNPHFFESVVEHFGIADPLGSQITNEFSRSLQPYERELFPHSAVKGET